MLCCRLALAFVQTSSMLASVLSAAFNGIEAFPVEEEVNSSLGDTIIVMVGVPDMTVKKLLPT